MNLFFRQPFLLVFNLNLINKICIVIYVSFKIPHSVYTSAIDWYLHMDLLIYDKFCLYPPQSMQKSIGSPQTKGI